MESEDIILSEIKNLSKSKTIIMITHRLSNVTDADCIYCMEDGQVVGQGTHNNIYDKCDTYRKLWDRQSELESYTGRRSAS